MIAEYVIPSLVGIVGAGGLAAVSTFVYKVYRYLDAQIEQYFKRNLQESILTGLNFAINRYRAAEKAEVLPISLKPNVIVSVMSYVKMAVPDALKKFGMDLDTKEGRARLQTTIEARFEPWMFVEEKVEEAKEEAPQTEANKDVVH